MYLTRNREGDTDMKITINLFIVTVPLTLLFAALKLFGVLSWSWWAVTSPIWAPILISLCFGLVLMLVVGVVFFVMLLLGKKPVRNVDESGKITYSYKFNND